MMHSTSFEGPDTGAIIFSFKKEIESNLGYFFFTQRTLISIVLLSKGAISNRYSCMSFESLNQGPFADCLVKSEAVLIISA